MVAHSRIAFYSSIPQQGKSTGANYLSAFWGFKRFAFARPLKNMLIEFLVSMGISRDTASVYLESPEFKEKGIPGLPNYMTPRFLMESLGTDWGRNLDPDIWVLVLQNKLQAVLNDRPTTCVVVDDLRFPNEWNMLASLGFKFIKVVKDIGARHLFESMKHNKSDGLLPEELFKPDAVIFNTGDFKSYYNILKTFIIDGGV